MKICEQDPLKLKSLILNIIDHSKNNHVDRHPSSRCKTDVNYEPSKTIVSDSNAELLLRKVLERTLIYKSPGDFVHCMDTYLVECFNNSTLQYHDKRLGSHCGEKLYKFQTDLSVLDWNNHVNSRRVTSTKPTPSECYQEAGGQEVLFLGHSVAGLHRNLSPMRYMVGHFLHVFAYIPLTRVQLFIEKPCPFAQIETDVGAHVQIFGNRGFKPVLNWANVGSPNILQTVRRTMIHFLIELLVRQTWFRQSRLYFILNWLVMRCKLWPELTADAQQTA